MFLQPINSSSLNDLGDSRVICSLSFTRNLTFGIKRKRDSSQRFSLFSLVVAFTHTHSRARSSLVPSDQIQTTNRFHSLIVLTIALSLALCFTTLFLTVCSIIFLGGRPQFKLHRVSNLNLVGYSSNSRSLFFKLNHSTRICTTLGTRQ